MNLTSDRTNAVLYLKIELDGLTLRYATENITANDTDSNTYFWEGRIAPEGISSLTAGFNDFRESAAIISSVSVKLINGKDYSSGSTLDSLISSYFWGNKSATVYMSESGTLATSDILFKGVISFPDTFSTHNETEVSFTINDNRYNDQILVNPNIYERGTVETETKYPLIRDTDISKHIPIIYGDFSNYPVAIGAMVDAVADDVVIKIADTSKLSAGQTPIHSVQGTTVDGIGKPYSSVTVADATYLINQDFLQIDSEVAAFVKGKTRGTKVVSAFGGSSGDLLEHPVEVLYDLLSLHLSIADTEMDLTQFLVIRDLDSNLKCKAYLSTPVSATDLIQSLCFEFGLDLFRLGELFTINYVSFATPASTTSMTQDDFVHGSYGIANDSNRMYFNHLTVKFDKTYDNIDYLKGLVLSHTQKIEFHGIPRDNAYEATWAMDEAQIAYRFGRLLYIASLPVKVVTLKGLFQAFNRTVDNWISLTYHIYSAYNLLIRAITKDPYKMTGALTLWDMGSLSVKDWAGAVAAPANLAAAQAATYAIYHAQLSIITGFNDTIKINYNGAGDVTVTFTEADYGTVTAFTTAITSQLTAQLGSAVTFAYNTTTYRFSFSAASNFVIKWTDIPEFGRCIGFDISSNDTGTNTYTADNIAPIDGINQIANWN